MGENLFSIKEKEDSMLDGKNAIDNRFSKLPKQTLRKSRTFLYTR